MVLDGSEKLSSFLIKNIDEGKNLIKKSHHFNKRRIEKNISPRPGNFGKRVLRSGSRKGNVNREVMKKARRVNDIVEDFI